MNNEDTAVLDYFKHKKNGFYVDVGCHHPICINNTYLLYKKNWSGINIDVSEFSIDLFNYMRPDDLNYKCAVSNKNKVVTVDVPIVRSAPKLQRDSMTTTVNQSNPDSVNSNELLLTSIEK